MSQRVYGAGSWLGAIVKNKLSFVCRLFVVMGADRPEVPGKHVFAKNELLPFFELRRSANRGYYALGKCPANTRLTFKICLIDLDQRLQTTPKRLDISVD
jgi:hypothetical protein